MARFIPGRQKKRLVLDLGSSAIRLCELKKTKSGYQLTRYLQKEFSADPAQDEETRRKAKTKALNELLKESKVRKRKVIFAVPGQSVFTRSRALPPVQEFKVTQIVRYEIQQQIPFSLDQIAMDYQILGRTEAGGYDVMMAAIKVEVVDKQLDVLLGANLEVDVVDVSPLAAYNWLKQSGEFGEQGECVAIIDIGATTTDIVIERENQFRFTRPLNIGGNDITLAIASAFGMNYADAEKVKRQRAFAPTGDPQRDGKAGEVVGKVLQRMVSEVMRSFSYFRSLPGGGAVNRVVLCGGGASMRNMVPFMQSQLGVEVRIAQPLSGLAIAPGAQQANENPESAAVALGLALRCNESVPIEINLIPPRVIEAARRREQIWYYSLSIVTAALILASIIPVSHNRNQLVEDRIQTLKQYIQSYDPQLAVQIDNNPNAQSPMRQELEQAWQQIRALQNDVQTLDQARTESRYWLHDMQIVNDARPPGNTIWFDLIESSRIGGDQPQHQRPQQRPGVFGGQSLTQAGVGPGQASRVVASSGFPGVSPGAAGMFGGGGQRGGQRGGRPQQQQQTTVIPEANGLRIRGFARSPQIVKEFVQNLRRAQIRLPDGSSVRVTEAHWSDAEMTMYDASVLYNTRDGGGSRVELRPGEIRPDVVYRFEVNAEIARGRETPGGGGGGGAQVAAGGGA